MDPKNFPFSRIKKRSRADGDPNPLQDQRFLLRHSACKKSGLCRTSASKKATMPFSRRSPLFRTGFCFVVQQERNGDFCLAARAVRAPYKQMGTLEFKRIVTRSFALCVEFSFLSLLCVPICSVRTGSLRGVCRARAWLAPQGRPFIKADLSPRDRKEAKAASPEGRGWGPHPRVKRKSKNFFCILFGKTFARMGSGPIRASWLWLVFQE